MVFADEQISGKQWPHSRLTAVFIALPVLLSPILAIASAKMSPVSLVLTAATIAAFAYVRGGIATARFARTLQRDSVVLSILAFAAFAGLSALWSPVPTASLLAAGSLVGVTACAYAGISLAAGEFELPERHLAEGLWMGFLIATIYYLCDVVSGQTIKIWAYNAIGIDPSLVTSQWVVFKNGKVVKFTLSDETRNAFVIPLLIWPALMAADCISKTKLKCVIKGLLISVAAGGVFLSPNDTAKLAIVFGAMAFGAARLSRIWSLRFVIGIWLAGCLLALPVASGLDGSRLEKAARMPPNGRARIKIWRSTADETYKSPLIGIGANASSAVSKRMVELRNDPAQAVTVPVGFVPAAHAHNISLQTWYELGVCGAALLSIFGLGILLRIGQLPERTFAFGLATFASGAMLASSSSGLWQLWFLAMFGWAGCAFQIGRQILERDNGE